MIVKKQAALLLSNLSSGNWHSHAVLVMNSSHEVKRLMEAFKQTFKDESRGPEARVALMHFLYSLSRADAPDSIRMSLMAMHEDVMQHSNLHESYLLVGTALEKEKALMVWSNFAEIPSLKQRMIGFLPSALEVLREPSSSLNIVQHLQATRYLQMLCRGPTPFRHCPGDVIEAVHQHVIDSGAIDVLAEQIKVAVRCAYDKVRISEAFEVQRHTVTTFLNLCDSEAGRAAVQRCFASCKFSTDDLHVAYTSALEAHCGEKQARDKFDCSGDNQLTRSEWVARFGKEHEHLYDAFDANRDNILSLQEWIVGKAAETSFSQIDTDANGVLSREEWIAKFGNDDKFDEYDTHSDGEVSEAEWNRGQAVAGRQDTDLHHLTVDKLRIYTGARPSALHTLTTLLAIPAPKLEGKIGSRPYGMSKSANHAHRLMTILCDEGSVAHVPNLRAALLEAGGWACWEEFMGSRQTYYGHHNGKHTFFWSAFDWGEQQVPKPATFESSMPAWVRQVAAPH